MHRTHCPLHQVSVLGALVIGLCITLQHLQQNAYQRVGHQFSETTLELHACSSLYTMSAVQVLASGCKQKQPRARSMDTHMCQVAKFDAVFNAQHLLQLLGNADLYRTQPSSAKRHQHTSMQCTPLYIAVAKCSRTLYSLVLGVVHDNILYCGTQRSCHVSYLCCLVRGGLGPDTESVLSSSEVHHNATYLFTFCELLPNCGHHLQYKMIVELTSTSQNCTEVPEPRGTLPVADRSVLLLPDQHRASMRQQHTAFSQYVSIVCLPLGPFGTSTVHLPPFSHLGSSHFGSMPFLNKWKSAPAVTQLGGLILLYRLQIRHESYWSCRINASPGKVQDDTYHQKSSTVSKVYTDRRLEP